MSDVAIASVHSEQIRLKKLIMIIFIIINEKKGDGELAKHLPKKYRNKG